MKDLRLTIRHLKRQIDVAETMGSQFVYITLSEAKSCLELAEAQDVIMEMLAERKAETK